MKDTEFKEQLLKLASEIRGIASDMKEQEMEKKAMDGEDFSIGSLGQRKPSSDPIMDFLFS